MNSDGGGARHVGPPRTLEIQNFAAARAVEVQALYKAVKSEIECSGGDRSSLTVARHLRRRTTSHNRRVPYWILQKRKKNGGCQDGREQTLTKNGDGLPASGSTPDVQKNEVGKAGKRKNQLAPPCRRIRRRIEFQRVKQGADSVAGDGTRRLSTHVWHAKRFPMKKCWGYFIPKGLPGRGRGSRSVLKWVKEAALLHDASYHGLIELRGSRDAIVRSLQLTLEPPVWCPGKVSDVKKAEAHGLLHANSMLYHVGKAPYDLIAPVNYLWRPSSSEFEGQEEASEGTHVEEFSAKERQLWIWVHPAAYDTALQCLTTACKKQANKVGSLVKCESRRGEYARLELVGRRSTEVLRKVMHPSPRNFHLSGSNSSGHVHEVGDNVLSCSAVSGAVQPLNLKFFTKVDCLPSSAVLALDVFDPRCITQSSLSKPSGDSSEKGGDDGKENKGVDGPQLLGNKVEVVSDGQSKGEASEVLSKEVEEVDVGHRWWELADQGLSRQVSDSEALWSQQSGGSKCSRLAPMHEKKLSEKRHEKRKMLFTDVTSGSFAESSKRDSEDLLKTSSVCPVILLKSTQSMSPACGWTIIIPIKWVHAFWIPLVFAGGHVIGLRERRWVASNAGTASFPHDFPDSAAYAQIVTADNAASNEINSKRPPGKRFPCFQVSPLQVSVLKTFRDSSQSNTITKRDEAVCTDTNLEMFLDVSLGSEEPGSTAPTQADDSFIHKSEGTNIVSKAYAPDNVTVPSILPQENSLQVEPLSATECRAERFIGEELISCAIDGIPTCTLQSLNSATSEPRYDGEGPPFTELGSEIDDDGVIAGGADPSLTDVGRRSTQVNDQDPDSRVLLAETAFSGISCLGTELHVLHEGCSVNWSATNIKSSDISLPPLDARAQEVESLSAEFIVQSEQTIRGDGEQVHTLINSHTFPTESHSVLEPKGALSFPAMVDVQAVTACPSSPPEKLQVVQESCEADDVERSEADGARLSSESKTLSVVRSQDYETSNRALALVQTEALEQPIDNEVLVKNDLNGANGGGCGESGEGNSLKFFVARTKDVLLETFNLNKMKHALILHQGVTPKVIIRDFTNHEIPILPIRQEADSDFTGSKLVHSVMNRDQKVCYVRVMVSVPNKGVLEEGAVLCSPLKEDNDAYLKCKQWHGPDTVQHVYLKSKRKSKHKGKMAPNLGGCSESKDHLREDAEASCKAWSSNRNSIGVITSSVPRGSASLCSGICDVGALMKLRETQIADGRWCNRSDTLVLAGNKYSSKFRPVFIFLTLEKAEHDLDWW